MDIAGAAYEARLQDREYHTSVAGSQCEGCKERLQSTGIFQ